MKKNNEHIISSFQWDTSFDKKERATELQDRLSNWSKTHLPREIANAFDKICPQEQTWKIQSLEIDLGTIDFHNLEFELTTKLYRQLNEKLHDIIIAADSSNGNVEIVNGSTSQLNMIGYFLLHGLMPWNYKPVDGSVNQMLVYQLQNNRQAIIAMLREAGTAHNDIRKRIAWQISEPNIVEIMKGLEPNNHSVILDFSTELIKIQKKETIVKTSIADFKKNLWYWTLNYLLIERGTLFNKVSFMKSRLRQMAEHYNTSYEQLCELLGRAIEAVNQSATISNDFILVLKEILKEDTSFEKKQFLPEGEEIDFWAILKNYFQNQSVKKSPAQKAEFNELVINLSRQNRQLFFELLLSLNDNESIWLQAINDLSDASLESIISVLTPQKATVLIDSIYLLEALGKELSFAVERKTLWKISINFLYEYKNPSFDNKLFLNYCIDILSKKNKVVKERMLVQLMSAEIPATIKNIAGINIYDQLSKMLISTIAHQDSAFTTEHFKESLTVLSDYINAGIPDKAAFSLLQRSLIRYIQLYPRTAVEILITYPDKDQLKKISTYILNDSLTQLLLKNTKKEYTVALSLLQQTLRSFKDNTANEKLAVLIGEHLQNVGLYTIIFYPTVRSSGYLKFILKELAGIPQISQHQQFASFLDQLIYNDQLRSLGISTNFINTIRQQINATEFNLDAIQRFIKTARLRQHEVAVLLAANFSDRQFVEYRKDRENKGITSYLLGNGDQLMPLLIKEYTDILIAQLKNISAKEIETDLFNIYWKCLVNYSVYRGNPILFKKLFKETVAHTFLISHDVTSGINETATISAGETNKAYTLQNGNKIPENKVFFFIEKCLAENVGFINENGSTFQLDQLIEAGLELSAASFRKLIINDLITEKHIDIIKSAVSFNHFTSWIADGVYGTAHEGVSSIMALYDLMNKVAPDKISDGLLRNYWEHVLALIKTNSWPVSSFEKLVQDSVFHIYNNTSIDSAFILSVITKENIRITASLKNALTKCISIAPALLTEERAVVSKQLKVLEEKGLLDNLIHSLLTQKEIPLWLGITEEKDVKELLNELIAYYPVKIFVVLKAKVISERQMTWLSQVVDYKALTRSIGNLNNAPQSLLSAIEEFHLSLANISIGNISAKEIQSILFGKLIKAWTSNNWKIISIENIWNELIWDVCVKRQASKKDFIQAMDKIKFRLPSSLQVSFQYFKEQQKAQANEKNKVIVSRSLAQQRKDTSSVIRTGVTIMNAGLVLLNSYIPLLFERSGFVIDKKMLGLTSHLNAVHYLQYVATGLSIAEESQMPLNKILCGVPINHPIQDEAFISDEHKELINGLIKAVIEHWPAIGNSTIEGFRGNWLVREGLLIEFDDKWELTVEKRAYDLLINKSMFSFSIIKYPWMDKPLHVNWAY
jgi:hypothetical protein